MLVVREWGPFFEREADLPEFCFDAARVLAPRDDVDGTVPIAIGLARSGKLHIAPEDSSQFPITLATNVNSFTIASNFLIFTTTAHFAHFAPLRALRGLLEATPGASVPEWETRRVERGSRIVTAVPSAMSLVLQMPRGNLETVYPRPLVMEVVKNDIDVYACLLEHSSGRGIIDFFLQREIRQSVCGMPKASRGSQGPRGAQSRSFSSAYSIVCGTSSGCRLHKSVPH